MSGGFLRSGSRRAHGLLLRQLRPSPLCGELSKPSSAPVRAYNRSHLLSSKFKQTSSGHSPASPSLYSPSLSPATAAGSVNLTLFDDDFGFGRVVDLIITLSSSDSLDLIRTLRMAGYGMFISGPSLHFWFNFVSRVLPKRDVLTTFKKMALGQAIYGPIMTGVFFSLNAGLQGETGAEIFARLKRDLIPTLKSGVVYWPLCDFITFKFIPVRLQPLVSNSFSFLWTIYITYMASLEKADVEKISTD
ncbi:hypothetical protein C4D60_Mb04t06710 [Musa balbisiana]|uniref:Uncharacterized protein n=1 Tax=Musa balbisiana TaxID=52838 RepID=A0A4S8KA46_MUSBA|nr:hypothetical protein C4D60_Mb04t06710 [Musa balbisiana]